MLNFTYDKNEVVFVDMDKSQNEKKWCAVMHNNFVNIALNHARSAKCPAE